MQRRCACMTCLETFFALSSPRKACSAGNMRTVRRLEGWGIAAATLATAVSRVLALARTPWDWDELLFMLALDHYDVAAHRPHPPGFPLYIFAAKVVRKL